MELVAFVAILGLVGILAARFGADSRPGLIAGDRRLVDVSRSRSDDLVDLELALQLHAARPVASAPARAALASLDTAAFAAVGLRLETPRAEAFAAALCQTAAEERAFGDGGWTGRAVDRIVRSVDVAHLAGVTADLGMGRLIPTDDDLDAGARTALQALLTHLLRDRLQDALRVQAGLPAFWPWEARVDRAAPSGVAVHDRAGSPAADQFAA